MSDVVKTTDEIVEHISYMRENHKDILGFRMSVLFRFLKFEDALNLDFIQERFDEDESIQDGWDDDVIEPTRENVIADMVEYMDFALGKAIDHRGLSASRSIEKMTAWLWLLNDEKTLEFAEDDSNYASYGAPILKKICEVYKIENSQLDSKRFQTMAEGKPCTPDCEMGCI